MEGVFVVPRGSVRSDRTFAAASLASASTFAASHIASFSALFA